VLPRCETQRSTIFSRDLLLAARFLWPLCGVIRHEVSVHKRYADPLGSSEQSVSGSVLVPSIQ
jgi:hypothetical protein